MLLCAVHPAGGGHFTSAPSEALPKLRYNNEPENERNGHGGNDRI